jgi:hypothetical protein
MGTTSAWRPAIAMARRTFLMTTLAGALISCASAPSLGHADDISGAQDGGPVKVLVLGEDDHVNLVARDDPAFRRVMSELQDMMYRRGFRVVDEAAIAADLGWGWRGTLDRAGVLELAKLANASETARNRVRAAVVFRIEASVRDLAYTSRVSLHVSGELYDVVTNRYLGGFDLPTETVSTPGRCLTAACASDAVGTRARDLAGELGDALSRKLAYLADPDETDPRRVVALEAVYTVTLQHLETEDSMAIVEVMRDEFPGYRSHELIRSGSEMRRYEYVTAASGAKLERWLTLLLLDMGLDPENEIMLRVRESEILIERVLPRRARQ